MNKETYTGLQDGVYFISIDENGNKEYTPLTQETESAPAQTKYIGIKMGDRAIAVTLQDLPGDRDGELELIPYGKNKCPRTGDHYTYDDEKDEWRYNAFEDFNGEENTKRLMECGCQILLPEGTWIPSMGQLGIMMMNAGKLNRALELAGGKPMKYWFWSSTENNAATAWFVNFSNGGVNFDSKSNSYAVRAVAAFN